MNTYEWLQTILFFVVLLALVKPLGSFMAKVFQGERTFLSPVLVPCEKLIYRISGVKPEDEMGWKRYAGSMLLFNLVLFVVALRHADDPAPAAAQSAKSSRPSPGNWRSTRRSALSTNTNWQAYVGEQAASYFTQMVGLAVHNFVSAATGIVIAIAVIRGFVRRKTSLLGNFWVDMTRCTLYILLPISIILSLVLVSQGVIQNFSAYKTVPLVQSTNYDKPKMDDKGVALKDAKGNPVTENVIVKEVSDSDGAGRLPGSDQGVGHQRRRLLQRQLGPPFRKSDTTLQLYGDPADPADPRRIDLHLRGHGGQHPPGVDAAGRDALHPGRCLRCPAMGRE